MGTQKFLLFKVMNFTFVCVCYVCIWRVCPKQYNCVGVEDIKVPCLDLCGGSLFQRCKGTTRATFGNA